MCVCSGADSMEEAARIQVCRLETEEGTLSLG